MVRTSYRRCGKSDDGKNRWKQTSLLGHQSIRITEKYYAAWTDSRQRQIEADLQSAWERDPVILLEAKVTRELRGKNDAVN